MQLAFSAVTLVALIASVAADSCSTGPIHCCNAVGTTDDATIVHALGVAGVVVSDPTVLVGATCSPITVIGSGTSTCEGHTVCCNNNNYNGVVVVGCTIIDV